MFYWSVASTAFKIESQHVLRTALSIETYASDFLTWIYLLFVKPSHWICSGFARTLTISINISNHILQFQRRRILPQSSHDNSNLVSGDETATIMIEEFESLAEI